MSKVLSPTANVRTVADLLKRLGNIPPERVWFRPMPGTATEQDVIDIEAHEDRLCELVDGILVEKAMCWYESRLAAVLIALLDRFLERFDLGFILDGTGMASRARCACRTCPSFPDAGGRVSPNRSPRWGPSGRTWPSKSSPLTTGRAMSSTGSANTSKRGCA